MIAFDIPIRTRNPLNGSRKHWSIIARHRRFERKTAWMIALAHLPRTSSALPCVVTMRRLSAGTLDETEGALAAALKSVRDGIADALGLKNDEDERVQWRYEQQKCARGKFGVRVRIEASAVETTWTIMSKGSAEDTAALSDAFMQMFEKFLDAHPSMDVVVDIKSVPSVTVSANSG